MKGKIDNWQAYCDNKNLDVHFHVCGEFGDKYIRTSRVVSIIGNILTTKNSVYELGFPKEGQDAE